MSKKSVPAFRKKKKEDGLQENLISSKEYAKTLADIKHQIQEAQIKAVISVNKELIRLYWNIGSSIIEKQTKCGWGSKIVERLAKDLRSSFPGMKGFSSTSIKYMAQFAKAYPDFPISQQAAGQIPWGHNMLLLDKLKSIKERLWYAKKTIENGWSRAILNIWIENGLYNREGRAISNFKNTLPDPQSDFAQQATKDPYVFEFLSIDDKFRERELEQALIDHIQNLLMEFGRGFAFIGRQVELVIDGKAILVDLLFYHVVLHCYVVVELKSVEFEPEFAGKMNFYLGVVDRLLKKENDNPSIGLILCKSKSKLQVEVALQDINKPIGVSDYVLAIKKGIPKEFASSLPTIKEIEAELKKDLNKDSTIKKPFGSFNKRKGRK